MRLQILCLVAGVFGLLVLMACRVGPAYAEQSLPPGEQITTQPSAFGPWFHAFANHENTSSSPYIGPKRVRIKWRWEVPGGGYVGGVPVIDSEGNVYLDAGGRCYCVSPDGHGVWAFPWPGRPGEGCWVRSVAVSQEGAVYLAAVRRLYAVTSEGDLKWQYEAEEGNDLWSVTLARDGQTAYTGTSAFVAVDTADGKVKWRRSFPKWYHSWGPPAMSSDGTLYLTGDYQEDIIIQALDSDGTLLWNKRLPSSGGSWNFSRPLICNQTLYAVTNDGHVCALDLSGHLKWDYQIQDRGFTHHCAASPSTDTLYVGGASLEAINPSLPWENHYMYAFGSDGTLRWKRWLKGSVDQPFLVDAAGNIYVQVYDCQSEDGVTASILYRITPDGTAREILASPASLGAGLSMELDGLLYITSDHAIYALKEDEVPLMEPGLVERLIPNLKDDDWRVRWHAAWHLGPIGDARAAEPLAAAMGDADEDVWWTAAYALERMGEPGVAALIAALEQGNSDVQLGAVKALGMMGEAGVDGLTVALEHHDPDVRRQAITEASDYREDESPLVEPLAALLTDEYWDIREAAADTLFFVGDSRAVEALILALDDEVWIVRANAAQALGHIGDNRAAEPLIGALEDPHDWVRMEAARALGWIGDSRAVGPLITVLQDEEQGPRLRAAEALGEITQEDFRYDNEAWQKWWEENKPKP